MVGSDKKYLITCKISECMYYLYFGIMLFAKGIGLYEGMTLYNICLLSATGILALKLAMDSYSFKEIAVIAALILVGVLIWRSSGEKGPLLYLLLIIGMKNIPIKRLFKAGLLIWGTAFAIQVILALAGVRNGVFVAHKKLGLGHIIRWSLGYPHPNVLHISYVILIAFLLYVLNLKGKNLIKATILCFVGNLYIFMYSVSYTGLALTVIYLICNFYFNYRTKRTKAEDFLVQAVFPCCILFSVIGPVVIKGRLFELIDKILNTRYYLSNRYLTDGNWSLFGNAQPQMREESLNFTLDCSYTYLLMYCGMVIFILMCLGYFSLIRQYVKQNKNKELAIITGLLIAGISEPFLFNTAYKNLSLLFMGSFLFDRLANWNKQEAKTIQILSWGSKEIIIPITSIRIFGRQIMNTLLCYKKKILIAAVVFGLLSGAAYTLLANIPDSIYMLQKGNDRYEEIVYLDIHNLPENFNSRILSYKDENTPMYVFKGNMIMVEYVRGIISSTLFGGVGFAAVYTGLYCLKRKRENNSENFNDK